MALDCGLITENCRGFFAKRPGLTASGRLTGHAALRYWPVHRTRGGPRGRARSTADRGAGRGSRDGGVVRGGGTIAGSGELTAGALQGTTGRSEGTGA